MRISGIQAHRGVGSYDATSDKKICKPKPPNASVSFGLEEYDGLVKKRMSYLCTAQQNFFINDERIMVRETEDGKIYIENLSNENIRPSFLANVTKDKASGIYRMLN